MHRLPQWIIYYWIEISLPQAHKLENTTSSSSGLWKNFQVRENTESYSADLINLQWTRNKINDIVSVRKTLKNQTQITQWPKYKKINRYIVSRLTGILNISSIRDSGDFPFFGRINKKICLRSEHEYNNFSIKTYMKNWKQKKYIYYVMLKSR